jgi:hypothetical protein
MKRTLALGAAWTGSAAAAVGLGFLAVSLVDASASPATQPVATGSSTSASATPTSAGPVVSSGQQSTVGGTVFASCTGGTADLASAPAAGWWVDDSSEPGEVEFENGSIKVEVHTVCVDGGPQFTVEGPRADDSGGGSTPSTTPSSGSSSSSSPASSTSGRDDDSGRDDSSGRGGGGHGSDDSGGDDSGGGNSGSGGHGSDDD